jgi:hypothetical protein
MKHPAYVLLTVSLAVCLLGAGCAKKNTIAVSDGKGGIVQVEDTSSAKAKAGDISDDICKEFTPDFVYSVLHKPIVRVEPSPLATVHACDYYTDYKEDFYKDAKYNFVRAGGPSITIVLDNLNVEKQKEGRTYLGLRLDKIAKINMENIVSYRKDNSIWSIDLIINPNRFVWANYSNKAITDDELITFAAAMADKVQGRSTIRMEKNPIDLEKAKEEALGGSQQNIVTQFFDDLSAKNIQGAIAMMDANDDTKQGWSKNFATIESLKVNKVEEAFNEEWTPTRQTYKLELNVQVKPEGLQIGWENGKNFRWVTVEKATNGTWMIHELANNP